MESPDPRIEMINEKKLIGKRMVMSLSDNRTGDLWRDFMPRRKEIKNIMGAELYSIQKYHPHFFNRFDPNTEFEKWAAIEVSDFSTVPNGMEEFILIKGLYAVFHYKGKASAAASIFQYIIGTWLQNSDYLLDDRPSFEILGEKYKHEDASSEEEIWIPVKPKS